MKGLEQLSIFILLTLSCNNVSKNSQERIDIGKTIIAWNSATIQSLNKQIESNDIEEDLYIDWREAFKVSEGIIDINIPDTNSLETLSYDKMGNILI